MSVVEFGLTQRQGQRIAVGRVYGQDADLIAGNARLMPTRQAALNGCKPGGTNHYGYYPSMANERFGYEWKVFKIADDAWWPALVRTTGQ